MDMQNWRRSTVVIQQLTYVNYIVRHVIYLYLTAGVFKAAFSPRLLQITFENPLSQQPEQTVQYNTLFDCQHQKLALPLHYLLFLPLSINCISFQSLSLIFQTDDFTTWMLKLRPAVSQETCRTHSMRYVCILGACAYKLVSDLFLVYILVM